MNDDNFTCPICGYNNFSEFLPYKCKTQSSVFLGKSLVKCSSCRTLSVNPLPSEKELQQYYNSYWKEELSLLMLPLFREQAKARFDFFKKYLKVKYRNLSILDIGAGFGLIKKCLRRSLLHVNYDVVEVEPMAIAYLRKKIRPRHIFHNNDEVSGRYSLIIMSHILEHLTNPIEFLKSQKTRLEDSGILFIEAPNQDYLYKSFNEPHIIYFSPTSLATVVESAGFSIVDLKTCGYMLKKLVPPSALDFLDVELPVSFWESCIKGINNLISSKKKLTKKQLVEIEIRENQRQKMKKRAYILSKHVYDYGPDRQWIRLIAKPKQG